MTNTRRTWAQAWTQTEELLPSGLWLQTVSGYDLKRPWCPLVAKKLNYISVRHPDHNEASVVQLRTGFSAVSETVCF